MSSDTRTGNFLFLCEILRNLKNLQATIPSDLVYKWVIQGWHLFCYLSPKKLFLSGILLSWYYNFELMALLNPFWSQLWQTLNHWDQSLFLKINTEWTDSFLDNVFPWYRDSNTWVPLYLFLFLFLVINFGWRIWPWILFFVITITLCDQISSTFIKIWINRTRPCNDQALVDHIRLLLNYCPGNGSFTSSHATNHFGMACFIFFTLRSYLKNWSYLFFVWAATISYGQVYIGIHYPLDVIGGAAVGSLIGILTSYIFNRFISLPELLRIPKNVGT